MIILCLTLTAVNGCIFPCAFSMKYAVQLTSRFKLLVLLSSATTDVDFDSTQIATTQIWNKNIFEPILTHARVCMSLSPSLSFSERMNWVNRCVTSHDCVDVCVLVEIHNALNRK